MPAYEYDPYLMKVHRMRGGTFRDYQDKSYRPLNDEQLVKHLKGEQLVGLYPLLKDHSSWFIAADFDKEHWESACRLFLKICQERGIPAYLERSRSGKGGHVWIFFEQPYQAFRSRKTITHLLEESGVFSVFDKSSSFDRLFPNQDRLSGKGLGNLIALPLHKPAWLGGNSCFVDPDTLIPYEDQWAYLRSIKKISISELERVYQSLSGKRESSYTGLFQEAIIKPGKISLMLNNTLHIRRDGLTDPLTNFLKEELNFTNSEYLVKKKMGKNTWGVERYFRFIEETENEVTIPRGFARRLLLFCKEHGLEYDLRDERQKSESVSFLANFQLRAHQETALKAAEKKDFGVIVAPPGAGKTVIGLALISRKQQPALIVVHRKQLLDQWTERIESFLGIPRREIGKIGQGKHKTGKQITVAMIQSLGKKLGKEPSLSDAFGTILVDECHHVPAETFRNTISKLHSYYLYGLTATPLPGMPGPEDKTDLQPGQPGTGEIVPIFLSEAYREPGNRVIGTITDILMEPGVDSGEPSLLTKRKKKKRQLNQS